MPRTKAQRARHKPALKARGHFTIFTHARCVTSGAVNHIGHCIQSLGQQAVFVHFSSFGSEHGAQHHGVNPHAARVAPDPLNAAVLQVHVRHPREASRALEMLAVTESHHVAAANLLKARVTRVVAAQKRGLRLQRVVRSEKAISRSHPRCWGRWEGAIRLWEGWGGGMHLIRIPINPDIPIYMKLPASWLFALIRRGAAVRHWRGSPLRIGVTRVAALPLINMSRGGYAYGEAW